MKTCDKCRCTGRVKRVAEEVDGSRKAVYICPNPRCGNYRQEFAEEALPPATPEDEDATG